MRSMVTAAMVAWGASTAAAIPVISFSVPDHTPSNHFAPTPGETLRVVVDIQCELPMQVWEATLTSSHSGYQILASTILGGFVLNYTNAFDVLPKNSNGWFSSGPVPIAWTNDELHGVEVGTGYDLGVAPNGATSGFAMYFDIVVPDDGSDVSTIVGTTAFPDTYVAPWRGTTQPATINPLVLLPEPASALMSLLSLGLMRRRR